MTTKIIPITPVGAAQAADFDDAHARLDQAGFMRMMQMTEPRLSELVAKYKAKGYEVEVAPYFEGDELPPEDAPSSCGSGSSCGSAASTGGCSSGGCGTKPTVATPAPAPKLPRPPRQIVPGVGTIYVRLP